MAYTFKLGDTTFAKLSTTDGRFAIDCKVGAAIEDKKIYHVPGVDGNYLTRCGQKGRKIVVRMRYKGVLAAAQGLMETDRAAVENTAIIITDTNGNTYAMCDLVDDGYKNRNGSQGAKTSHAQ
jgi:hypothetical protein